VRDLKPFKKFNEDDGVGRV